MASCTPIDETGPTALAPGASPCVLLVVLPRAVQDLISPSIEGLGLPARLADSLEALRDHLYDTETAVAVVHFGRDVPAGLAICRTIRRHPSGEELPIIALLDAPSAADYPDDCPADDVVLLPCPPAEVALRTRLALRRRNASALDAVMRVGDITIDPLGMHVRELGVPVDLTYREYSLLCFLVQNPGVAFSRDAILASVWGDDYLGGERTVDIHVRRLRSKLTTVQARLETVHGIGYRLSLPQDDQ
jgi:DNA-binding response OmpR family regulator